MKVTQGEEVRVKIPVTDPETKKPVIGLDGKQKVLIIPAVIKSLAVDQDTQQPVMTVVFPNKKEFTLEGLQNIKERVSVPNLQYIDSLDL